MIDMLERLYAAKEVALREEEALEPYAAVAAEAERRRSARRQFAAALRNSSGPAIVAEIKRASPSVGLIVRELDPAEIARQYEAAGADAISVMTEADHFLGDIALSRRRAGRPACRSCARISYARRYEVVQSAAYGADAILSIVAGLDDAQLRRDDRRGAASTRSTCWSRSTTKPS